MNDGERKLAENQAAEEAEKKPTKRLGPWLFHGGALILLAYFLWKTGEVGQWSSATADEPIYIRSGLMILHEGDPAINEISSPFLFKPLLALPVMGLEGVENAVADQRIRRDRDDLSPLLDQWMASYEMMHRLGPRTVLPAARLISRLSGLLTGLILYLAALAALGRLGALFSLAVFVMLPEVSAHSSLATLESGLALATFLTLAALWKFLRSARPQWALFAGLGLAATLLIKTVGIVLCLFCALACCLRWIFINEARRRVFWGFFLMLALTWVALNGAYSFHGTFDRLRDRPEYPKIAERIESLPGGFKEAVQWGAQNMPLLLPRSYVKTLITQAAMPAKKKALFFNGELMDSGQWWLMPLTFVIKMPIPFLLMLPLAFLAGMRRRALLLYSSFALLLIIFFSTASQLFAWVRYLYPALPPLALVAGGGLAALLERRWCFKIPAILLLGWLFFADVTIHPHPLSYANEIAGGPKNLYRLLGDSNLDWGQDLPALKAMMEREKIPRVKLSYFGSDDPTVYGIDYEALPSVGLRPEPNEPWWFEKDYGEKVDLAPGVYAISANNLYGLFPFTKTKFNDPDLYSELRNRDPDFRAGYSILVYDLR